MFGMPFLPLASQEHLSSRVVFPADRAARVELRSSDAY